MLESEAQSFSRRGLGEEPTGQREEVGGWAQFVLGVKGEFFSEEFWERRQLEQAANHPSLSLFHCTGGRGVSLPTRLNPLWPGLLPGNGQQSLGETFMKISAFSSRGQTA